MQLVSFQSIALKYKAIFFDAYGVLKNHKGVIPGIRETISFLQAHDIEFYLLTNDASRSPEDLAAHYQLRGVDAITPDRIISSGMLALDFLKSKVNGGTVAYLGTSESAHYVETRGLRTISIRNLDLEHVDDIHALVLLDDEGFDWMENINKAVNLLRKRNMAVIVANTDMTYPVAKQDVAIAIGGIANMLEQIVQKTFIRFGKPDAQIFQFAYEHIQQHGPIDKREILMVGDTLHTDILGGNKFGIDTCLVLTGNTQPGKAENQIETTGIIPDYICESVVEG